MDVWHQISMSSFIISMGETLDETALNFVYKRGKVHALTGKEEVDAQLPDDIRKSFTAISTITAA